MSSPSDSNMSDSPDAPQSQDETIGIPSQEDLASIIMAATAMTSSIISSQNPNQEQPNSTTTTTTQTTATITMGPWRVDITRGAIPTELLDSLTEKPGPLPASKASIDDMPRIAVTESGKECAICLEEFSVGGEAREMPCKHWFHSGCVEKWLGIHGSCPVCRFAMPVEEVEEEKSTGHEMIIVTFFLRRADDERALDSNLDTGRGSGEDPCV